MKLFHLLWLYFRLGMLGEMEYRFNFFVQLGQSVLSMGAAAANLAIVFSHTSSLNGWDPPALTVLLGVFFMMGGVIGFVIEPSLQRLMEDIREGTLDFVLMKPEDAQLLVSVRQVRIWKLLDVVLGLIIITLALVWIDQPVRLINLGMFAIAISAGTVIVYSFWMLLTTLTFWFVKLENILVIFQFVYQAGRWPVTMYPVWLRIALTVIVPVAFATTVPAQAITQGLSGWIMSGTIVFAILLFSLSRLFWRVGIRHYSGASS